VSVVVTQECRGCGACLLTCPEHAIRPLRSSGGLGGVVPPGANRAAGPLAVLDSLCTDCGECVEICPADAIRVVP